jgi:tetratricopeptide (TPR) repeat protein
MSYDREVQNRQEQRGLLLNANGRNWNEEFQELLERRYADVENEVERTRSLAALCKEFGRLAAKLGKTIVEELYLLDEAKRTIPPVTAQVGGQAGGRKYFYEQENVFLKQCSDDRQLYGGLEFCMKAAGHELRSLKEYMDCRVSGLHFPLMVLVDHWGHRIVATPLLPLDGANTIIYGSADGAHTLHASNVRMNKCMRVAAKILNLRPHDVSTWSSEHCVRLAAPLDIEGHLGTDGRFYVLDTHRAFPPVEPDPNVKGAFLYRLMRPEFVKSHRVPLCSDAFTRWHVHNAAEFDQQVRDATAELLGRVLPATAQWLLERYNEPTIDIHASLMSIVVGGGATLNGGNDGGGGGGELSLSASDGDLVSLISGSLPCSSSSKSSPSLSLSNSASAIMSLSPSSSPPLLVGGGTAPTAASSSPASCSAPVSKRSAKSKKRFSLRMRRRKSKSKKSKKPTMSKGAAISSSLDSLDMDAFASALSYSSPPPPSNGNHDDNDDDQSRRRRRRVTVAPQVTEASPRAYGALLLDEMIAMIHARGVNVRYLGRIRAYCRARQPNGAGAMLAPSRAALTEMAARTVKNVLRARWRSIESSDAHAYVECTRELLNTVFGRSPQSRDYWTLWVRIKGSMMKRFEMALSDDECEDDVDLRPLLDMGALLARLKVLLSLDVERSDDDGDDEAPFARAHVSLSARTRTIHRVSFDEATALSDQAVMLAQRGGQSVDRLFMRAAKKYRATMESKPDAYRVLHNWGLSLSFQAQSCQDEQPKRAVDLYKLAGEKYAKALTINSGDARALRLWGDALCDRASLAARMARNSSVAAAAAASEEAGDVLLARACEKYALAVKLTPPGGASLHFNWGNALLDMAMRATAASDNERAAALYGDAIERYRTAHRIKPLAHKALRNWGVALSKLARVPAGAADEERVDELFEEAEERLAHCIELHSADHVAFFNWGNVLYRRATRAGRHRDFVGAHALLSDAAAKYAAALDIADPAWSRNYDPLYNWGKVVECQAAIEAAASQGAFDKRGSLLHERVERFLAALGRAALPADSRVRLAPIVALARGKHPKARYMARRWLASMRSDSEQVCLERNALLDSNKFAVTDDDEQKQAQQAQRRVRRRTRSVVSLSSSSAAAAATIAAAASSAGSGSLLSRAVQRSSSFDVPLHVDSPSPAIDNLDMVQWLGRRAHESTYKARSRANDSIYLVRRLSRAAVAELMMCDEREEQQREEQGDDAWSQPANHANGVELLLLGLPTCSAALRQLVDVAHRSCFVDTLHCFEHDDNDELWLLSAMVAHNELMFHLSLKRGRTREPHARFYAAELVLAIDYVHSRRLVCGMLQPSSFSLDSDGHLRLCSVALARADSVPFERFNSVDVALALSEAPTPSEPAAAAPFDLTRWRVPPELLADARAPCTRAIDWWFMGAALLAMLSNVKLPLSADAPSTLDSATCSDAARALIADLMHDEPERRLHAAAHVREHSFFAGIDWRAMAERTAEAPFRPIFHRKTLEQGFQAADTLVDGHTPGKFHHNTLVVVESEESM